jgi:hypothetical protein
MKSEIKSFENQWNEAFNEASVPPPDLVWDNIEKELDKKKKKRVAFLWWTNPAVLSGIAAALIVGLTVLFINNKSRETSNLSLDGQKQSESNKDNSGKVDFGHSREPENDRPKEIGGKHNNSLAVLSQKDNYGFGRKVLAGKAEPQMSSISPDLSHVANISDNSFPPKVTSEYKPVDKYSNLKISKLDQRGFKKYANRFQPFRSHIGVEFEESIAEQKGKENKLWFGLNSGVAPFNPNFESAGFTGAALTSARNDAAFVSKGVEQSLSPSNNASTANSAVYFPNGVPESSFKNGTAVNFGFSVGRKLKKRLGIESGLRYMQASAFLNTNVYSIEENTGKVSSFFHSNYLDTKSDNTQTVLSVKATNKQLYNYFNVPLLLNYSLLIVKNLSVEALGGVSGDLFVFGKSDAENPNGTNLTASNSTFNLLNFSGMGGLRLSYIINKSWEANMGSTYQRALTSGVSSEQNLSFKPRTFGINYGVRFKMK